MTLGPNNRPRGVVTAIGWTRDYAPPIDVGGEKHPAGRTAVVGRSGIASTDGTVAVGAARREIVRGPQGTDLPDDGDLSGSVEGALWRFTLPAGSSGALEVDVPRYIGRVDAWDGTAWVTIDESEPTVAVCSLR